MRKHVLIFLLLCSTPIIAVPQRTKIVRVERSERQIRNEQRETEGTTCCGGVTTKDVLDTFRSLITIISSAALIVRNALRR